MKSPSNIMFGLNINYNESTVSCLSQYKEKQHSPKGELGLLQISQIMFWITIVNRTNTSEEWNTKCFDFRKKCPTIWSCESQVSITTETIHLTRFANVFSINIKYYYCTNKFWKMFTMALVDNNASSLQRTGTKSNQNL